MLDTVEKVLQLFMVYGLPVLPYLGVSVVVYYVMNWIIKPLVAARKNAAGEHDKTVWKVARFLYPGYPMVLGGLASFTLPGLIWGYCVVAGLGAQLWYFVFYAIKFYLKNKGVAFPPDPGEPLEVKTTVVVQGTEPVAVSASVKTKDEV